MYANVIGSILHVYVYICVSVYLYIRAHARKATHTVQYVECIYSRPTVHPDRKHGHSQHHYSILMTMYAKHSPSLWRASVSIRLTETD